jgi:LysM repeat protein
MIRTIGKQGIPRRGAMHKWIRLGLAGMLIVVLTVAAGCVKSKLPPAPTVAAAQQVLATQTTMPTVQVGETVVSVEGTPTLATTPEASPTAIPSMTPTTESGSTPTTEVGATPTTEAGATPTTELPTATPVLEPEPEPTAPASTAGFDYVVETGDTLWGLALRFGTTVEEIKEANGLLTDTIYKGDTLIIPGTAGGGTTVTHVVQVGENLFRIALKYGTTVEAIAAANGIVNPNRIYEGQQLLIPQGGGTSEPTVSYHVVQPGETLSGIAMRYGTTPWAIAAANSIANVNYVRAGQTLRIP